MEVKQRLDKVISSVRTIQEDLSFEREVERMTEHLANRWLDAYGAVERERILTKDPTAIPRADGNIDGGSRGKAGDIADILTLHADVDMLLKNWGDATRDLVTFIHGACISTETKAIRFFFNDGSGQVDCQIHRCDDKCPRDCPSRDMPIDPPQNADRCEAIVESRLKIDWSKFPSTAVESTLEQWGCARPEFLIWRYLRFRSTLIHEKGLDLLAKERVSEGLRAPVWASSVANLMGT